MNQKIIKVLLVDDSPLVLTVLKRMLHSVPDIRVVGTAKNGEEAMAAIPELNPDVVCTDLHMPKMDGFELTRNIMEKFPRPILVVSISVQEREDAHNVFQALRSGAVDVFPKPRGGQIDDYDKVTTEFVKKIRLLSGVIVFTKHKEKTPTKILPTKKREMPTIKTDTPVEVIAIGSSTGGPQALYKVLKPLPVTFPFPIICVQHISEGFLNGLVDWLGYNCNIKVKIARRGEKPMPGIAYFAPESSHLELDSSGRFVMSMRPPLRGHRPSVSFTLSSVAKYYKGSTLGIILTGMGSDGVEGMVDIFKVGGITIAQDEDTSIVFGMPKQAIEAGVVKYTLPLEEIPKKLLYIAKK